MQTVINRLLPSIYRVKGFLYLSEQVANQVVIPMAGRRVAVSDGGAWNGIQQTRLVLIDASGAISASIRRAELDAWGVR